MNVIQITDYKLLWNQMPNRK